jgi:hypothetical protein
LFENKPSDNPAKKYDFFHVKRLRQLTQNNRPQVKLKCACENLTATVLCSQNESEYQRIHTAMLISKMANSASGSIVLNELWQDSQFCPLGVILYSE